MSDQSVDRERALFRFLSKSARKGEPAEVGAAAARVGVSVGELGTIATAMQERIVAAYEAAPPLADLLGPVGVETLDDVADYDWVTVGIYAFGLPPTKTRSGTPESSAHRALKEWAAAHPAIVGASAKMTAVTERWFSSGDESDVTFEGSDAATIVEVRPSEAEQHELRRAVFALVKLRAVMQAEDAVAGVSRDVSAVLVTPADVSTGVAELALALGVRIVRDGPS